jgi:fibronectin type III domain protein
MRKLARLTVNLVLMLLLSGVNRSVAADLTCSSSDTLEELATCIRLQMPQSGSNGFVAPGTMEQDAWRTVVNQMLQGSCSFSLPTNLLGIVQLRNFSDSSNGRSYCVLMEVRDANGDGFVDRGWGTFVVYSAATRELSHQAPHPIADSTTELQAITIFKDTESRSYLMAGAHRNANAAPSACQSSYNEADAAHNIANMFHATNRELMAFYGATAWNAIQWHGMAADTCPDTHVYATHGVNVLPAADDKISQLRDNVLVYHPLWDVDLPGVGACSLNATDNTQGRLLNGVAAASVCGTAASSYSGRFIHIEQDPNYRNGGDWVAPVKDTWRHDPPAAPSGLTATAGNAQVSLTWLASIDAVTYRVHRGTNSGGPYSAIASGLSGTSYSDTAVTNGIAYYYVVTALNAAGESINSNEAGAMPSAPAVPLAPTGLTATAGKKKITLKWTPSSGASGYNIKRKTSSTSAFNTIATGITGTTYTNTGLTTGMTYYYVVSATNAGGESDNSNPVSARAK